MAPEPRLPEVTDEFWENRFHWCVLAAGFLAAAEGRQNDDAYIKTLAYEFYETGAFRDRVPLREFSEEPTPHPLLDLPTGLSDLES